MKDQKHRDAFTDIYRVYERYETPPRDPDVMRDYVAKLNVELNQVFNKYSDNPVAVRMCFALLDGLVEIMDSYGTKNPPPEQTWMPGVKEWRN